MASKVPNEPIEPFLDPLKFYNHGDNPAMKNFMKIAMENVKDGRFIDHRSLVIDKGQRYLLARNWDDFLQRTLGGQTFPRAFGLFVLNTLFCISTYRYSRALLPIGKFGIRSVTETPLYHNFGYVGVAGAVGILFLGILGYYLGAYTEYKTFKFTLHKFYRHVLMGERSWFLEERKNTQRDGNYDFSDNLLGNEDRFDKSTAQKFATSSKSTWTPTFNGAYGENKK